MLENRKKIEDKTDVLSVVEEMFISASRKGSLGVSGKRSLY